MQQQCPHPSLRHDLPVQCARQGGRQELVCSKFSAPSSATRMLQQVHKLHYMWPCLVATCTACAPHRQPCAVQSKEQTSLGSFPQPSCTSAETLAKGHASQHGSKLLLGLLQVIGKRILIQGFIVSDYFPTVGPSFRKDMSQVWFCKYEVSCHICRVIIVGPPNGQSSLPLAMFASLQLVVR